jgi:steroid 5-alpha reductase family enzyme
MLLQALLITLGIQILFFAIAAINKTDKVTDLSYGLTFVILAWYLLGKQDNSSLQGAIITALITLWGVRLAGYLFVRILKIGKDARFDGIREKFFSFAKFWTLQGFAIWIIMLPSIILLSKEMQSQGLYLVSILGIVAWALGFTIETIADYQKYVFKNNPKNKGKFINSGVWKYARYPNYFGEILMWWSIFFIAAPHLQGAELLSVLSPIFISYLLLKGTGIPPLEKRYNKKFGKDPAYQKYKRDTNLLVPIPKLS